MATLFDVPGRDTLTKRQRRDRLAREHDTRRGSGDAIDDLNFMGREFFQDEARRLRGRQPGLEQAYLGALGQTTDLGRIREELSAVGEGVSAELFRPGGAVEDATRGALAQTVQTGFGPSSGGFDAARMNILEGARGRISNALARAAPQLAQTAVREDLGRLGQMGEFTSNQAALSNDLAQSAVGTRATAEQVRQAQEQLELYRRQVDHAIQQSGCGVGDRIGSGITGAGTGAMAGSLFPGPGTIIGGAAGFLGGVFGGC